MKRLKLRNESLDEIEQRLASRDFAANEQSTLTEIEKEIARLSDMTPSSMRLCVPVNYSGTI